MRVLVLGANGFLGSRLVQRFMSDSAVGSNSITELVLCDMTPIALQGSSAFAMSKIQGDITDKKVLDEIFTKPVDMIFHLAATLTLDSEKNFRKGIDTNVLALIELLERCRLQTKVPSVLFASSISTYGGQLPKVVGDDVFQAPTTSYGTQKVIAEHLLADYCRHGYIDGRALRLPIVVTHPGPSNGSISDQVSALIREPVRGQTVVCHMNPEFPMVVVSVEKVIAGFIQLASLPTEVIGHARSMNLPGLTVTPKEMMNAVIRHLGSSARKHFKWNQDPEMQKVMGGWPTVFTSARAVNLNITGDQSADEIVKNFLKCERR